ncbi:MAG: SRPBCC family protein [Acidimicrobiia bacterium]
MRPITVSIDIAAPAAAVWADVADLASHAAWMADAESIEFLSDRRAGVGTKMKVATRVGPLRTSDIIEITVWEPQNMIGVAHRGLVGGSGAIALTTIGEGTRFTWSETLVFPWWLGGAVAAAAARPVLTAVWKRNLSRLKRRLEKD